MFRDRYDNSISTPSAKARDLYIAAVDRLLAGAPGIEEGFAAVTAAAPDFALAHCGLARARHIMGDLSGARAALADANSKAKDLSVREASHLHVIGLLIAGNVADAYRAIRAHVVDYPRDAMVAQTCTSIFGLIGLSGQPGREAELLAYTTTLAPHYDEDWWFLSQHAFSLVETGQTARAAEMIERSLSLNSRNAHAAHVQAHVHYEAGEAAAGLAFLDSWLEGYDKKGIIHGHLSWHVALWALERGDADLMWRTVDTCIAPGAAWGRPLNVLSDNASILFRAGLAGHPVSAERWKAISHYAKRVFPKTGIGFADLHAALAHAMAGDGEALDAIIATAAGPAADLVREAAQAYRAFADRDWGTATRHLIAAMADHARIGGSRAQRDLLEYSLVATLSKQGRVAEARDLLALRRPIMVAAHPVQGI
jgi:hypothetical protein